MEIQQEVSKTIDVQQQVETNEIETTAPGKLRVIKRNGKVVAFEEDKIKVAITKAFLAEARLAAGNHVQHRCPGDTAEHLRRDIGHQFPR